MKKVLSILIAFLVLLSVGAASASDYEDNCKGDHNCDGHPDNGNGNGCNGNECGTGNPHECGETGNPHECGETGNPHC